MNKVGRAEELTPHQVVETLKPRPRHAAGGDFITVVTRDGRSNVEAYLYRGNKIVEWKEGSDHNIGLIDCTANSGGGFAAGPQADRLSSGLHWGTAMDEAAARAKFDEEVAYYKAAGRWVG